jgi:hypothetical protein
VQDDPITPVLKALKTMRLKLKVNEPLSSFAFKFNLRRYSEAEAGRIATLEREGKQCKAGAYTRSLQSSTRGPSGHNAHVTAQLEDLRDTSLTLDFNLSTFEIHRRVSLGYMGDKVSLS